MKWNLCIDNSGPPGGGGGSVSDPKGLGERGEGVCFMGFMLQKIIKKIFQ